MHAFNLIFAAVSVLVATAVVAPQASADEEWVRVMSEDKKASVLFPAKCDEVEVVSRRSPAGTLRTEITRCESEGAQLTINATRLPGVALAFAGEKRILSNAAEGVLSKHYGKKVSEKRISIDGAPAVVLEYLVPDYEDKDHPGYRGTAIAILLDDYLHIVNSILTKENPKSKAMQRKMLDSVRVHK